MADGGEGILDALGGANRSSLVTGPLGDPVVGTVASVGGTAIIEMAAASGLTLLGGAAGNDPLAASTTGTAELIANAIDAGARCIVVGVGGSATTDGGFGALRAMYPLPRACGASRSSSPAMCARPSSTRRRSSRPQKGASPTQVTLLQRRLERLAQVYRDRVRRRRERCCPGRAPRAASPAASPRSAPRSSTGSPSLPTRSGWPNGCGVSISSSRAKGSSTSSPSKARSSAASSRWQRHVGVPVLAVVGDVYDDADTRVETVALAARFGREQALGDTWVCRARRQRVASRAAL